MSKETFRQFGHGFVYFMKSIEGLRSALQVSSIRHKFAVNGVNYECNISHSLKNDIGSNSPYHHHHQQLPFYSSVNSAAPYTQYNMINSNQASNNITNNIIIMTRSCDNNNSLIVHSNLVQNNANIVNHNVFSTHNYIPNVQNVANLPLQTTQFYNHSNNANHIVNDNNYMNNSTTIHNNNQYPVKHSSNYMNNQVIDNNYIFPFVHINNDNNNNNNSCNNINNNSNSNNRRINNSSQQNNNSDYYSNNY